MTTAGWIHVLGVWAAAIFGLAVILGRKGDAVHRWTGRGYLAAMLVVNVAGLMIFEDRIDFGPFHALAGVSLATLAAGILLIRGGRRSAARISAHGHFMAWSFVGLVSAGAGQTAEMVGWSVPLTIAGVLVLGGSWVHLGGIYRVARRLSKSG